MLFSYHQLLSTCNRRNATRYRVRSETYLNTRTTKVSQRRVERIKRLTSTAKVDSHEQTGPPCGQEEVWPLTSETMSRVFPSFLMSFHVSVVITFSYISVVPSALKILQSGSLISYVVCFDNECAFERMGT